MRVKIFAKIKRSLRRIAMVYVREFAVLRSDLGVLLFMLFLPVAYPIVYSLIYNKELVREVPVVVVDSDRTAASRELVRQLDATPQVRIIGYAASLQEGKRAIYGAKAYGLLEVPRGFGKALGGGREQAHAVMYAEMSLLLRYKSLMMAATNLMLHTAQERQEQRADRAGAQSYITDADALPMQVEYRPLGNTTSGFDSFIMPGILILILSQSLVLAVAMRGAACFEPRRLVGYKACNYVGSVAESMVGQCCCYLTVMLLPVIWLVHVVPLLFRFPMEGSGVQIALFLLPLMLSSIMLGYVLRAVVRERENLFLVWIVTSVVLLFLSGLTWPIYAMPAGWRALAALFPSTWGIEGFIRMNTNGASLLDAGDAYLHLWLLCVAYGLGAYVVERFLCRPRCK